MKVTGLAHDWVVTNEYDKEARIGVNWASVGAVDTRTARRFARRVILCADMADKKAASLKKRGYKITHCVR